MEEVGHRDIGAERNPVHQIAAGLQNVGLAGRTQETKLERSIRPEAKCRELHRLDREQRAGGEREIARQRQRRGVEERIGRGQRAVEGEINHRVRVWRGERDVRERGERAAIRCDARRRERGRASEAVDPVADNLHGVRVNQAAGERRHLVGVRHSVHADVQHGAPDILRLHDVRVVNAKRRRRERADDVLIRERRVVARVKRDALSAGAMALRAIRIEVGACAQFQ